MTIVVLRGEVAVDGADADLGGAGDLVHAGLDALLRHHLARGRDTAARLRTASARGGRSGAIGVGMCLSGGLIVY